MNIVTHPGPAHRDEFLASCLLLASGRADGIVRRDCDEKDLQSRDTVVLDQGGRHEAEFQNFDHHQFPISSPACCSITLVLKSLGYDLESVREVWPWLAFTEKVDTRGAKEAASKFGIPASSLPLVHSPVETSLLQIFSRSVNITDPLLSMMVEIGEALLTELKDVQSLLEQLDGLQPITMDRIQVLDVTSRLDAHSAFISKAIEIHLTRNGWSESCAVLVLQDPRGPGLALQRRNDHPAVDFRQIQNHPQVTFVHNTGFLAKTCPDPEIPELLKLAQSPD